MILSGLFPVVRPLLHGLDAETAHGLTIAALKRLPARGPPEPRTGLAVNAMGLAFPNPLGLAAGFDKNADAPDQMLGLGFGFVETGTVTPLPQSGNPRPRLFRLREDRAVINRMGFNSAGAEAVRQRLLKRGMAPGIVGINIGANKDAADRIADYVKGVEMFGPLASYLAINISSPNTPGLRGLQAAGDYDALLDRVMAARGGLARKPPVLVKIAPDLSGEALDAIAAVSLKHAIDGLIVSNTTLSRPELLSRHRGEAGGLSGAPLFKLSTAALARMYQRVGHRLTLIGAGGIGGAADALAKIEAGASLVQLYSALVYEGPGLVTRILDGLDAARADRGVENIGELVGSRADVWAHQAGNGT